MNTRQSTSNGFAQGLMMDYHISGIPNNALSNALNATFVTYNGNEAILQNDLGNGRVESAYLPEGFVPLGTTSFGGIIYIVSYNPLEDVCQIGSFPSPERNISSEEASSLTVNLTNQDFNYTDSSPEASTFYVQKDLYNDKLNPGDKFIVYTQTNEIKNNSKNHKKITIYFNPVYYFDVYYSIST